MASKKATLQQNQEFTVQFALRAVVELVVSAKDFTTAIEEARALAKADGFVRDGVTYHDGYWEVIAVGLLDGWDVLED